MAMEVGVAPVPTEVGVPACTNTPLPLILNTAMVPSVALATNKKLPVGEIAIDEGCDAGTIGNGDPGVVCVG